MLFRDGDHDDWCQWWCTQVEKSIIAGSLVWNSPIFTPDYPAGIIAAVTVIYYVQPDVHVSEPLHPSVESPQPDEWENDDNDPDLHI